VRARAGRDAGRCPHPRRGDRRHVWPRHRAQPPATRGAELPAAAWRAPGTSSPLTSAPIPGWCGTALIDPGQTAAYLYGLGAHSSWVPATRSSSASAGAPRRLARSCTPAARIRCPTCCKPGHSTRRFTPLVTPVLLAELIAAASVATDISMCHAVETRLATSVTAARLAWRARAGGGELAAAYYLALLDHIGCTAGNLSFTAYVGDEMTAGRGSGPPMLSGRKRWQGSRQPTRRRSSRRTSSRYARSCNGSPADWASGRGWHDELAALPGTAGRCSRSGRRVLRRAWRVPARRRRRGPGRRPSPKAQRTSRIFTVRPHLIG